MVILLRNLCFLLSMGIYASQPSGFEHAKLPSMGVGVEHTVYAKVVPDFPHLDSPQYTTPCSVKDALPQRVDNDLTRKQKEYCVFIGMLCAYKNGVDNLDPALPQCQKIKDLKYPDFTMFGDLKTEGQNLSDLFYKAHEANIWKWVLCSGGTGLAGGFMAAMVALSFIR